MKKTRALVLAVWNQRQALYNIAVYASSSWSSIVIIRLLIKDEMKIYFYFYVFGSVFDRLLILKYIARQDRTDDVKFNSWWNLKVNCLFG